MSAFVADYVVLGGGNAKYFKELPVGIRQGHNLTAFRGGFRLWHMEGKGSDRLGAHLGASALNKWHFARKWASAIGTRAASMATEEVVREVSKRVA